MLWTCRLIYLAIFCAGVSLDVILEPETKTLTVLLGEPVTFRCNVTGGDLKNYQGSWYKKNEDHSLTLVYRLNSSNENVRSHFKGKIDTLKSQYILDIEKATTKDAGTYHCASDTHSAAVLFLTALNPPSQRGSGRSNESPPKTSTTLEDG